MENFDFNDVDILIKQFADSIENPKKPTDGKRVLVGVDLGTAYTVLVVSDENRNALCTRLRRTDIVRDGLVVDYVGAQKIVKELKKEAEDVIGFELNQAAIAIPPGTGKNDCQTHRYVVEGAGLNVINLVDEPTAANKVLNLKNGAVVDIGGGTTGVSIFKDGEVIYTADEPTGGTHFTYVIAGHYKIPFDEAEDMKINPKNYNDVYPLLIPVMQKVATIINTHIKGYDINRIVLCGGTSYLKGIEHVISIDTGIKTEKPQNPFLVTPVGIAFSCEQDGLDNDDIKSKYSID